jgi:type VII secretion-associated serine protease mycosin
MVAARVLPRALAVAALVAAAAGAAPAGAAAAPADDGRWWQVQWRMDEVWQITAGGGVTVAVLDTGVNASIPELAGAVLPGTDLTGASADGTVDHDDAGHGTSMASLVAGRGGDRGFRGVAPEATILPVTVSAGVEVSGDAVTIDLFARGIRYATDQGAAVISLSQAVIGDPRYEDGCPPPVAEAVRYAASNDVVVVAGSGNVAEGTSAYYPGNCPGVLTVGANDPQLEPWADSHRSTYVDASAPGTDIDVIGRDGNVYYGSGTSNATALVAGAIALVRAEFPDASAEEVLARVIHTARDIAAEGRDDATGYGVVRPFQALTESVPADAPNPVWEGLGETGPGQAPTAAASEPAVGMPPPSGEGGGGGRLLLVAGAGLLLLVIAAVVVGLLVARDRGRPARVPGAPEHG